MTQRANAGLVLHAVSDETPTGRASRQAAEDVLALLLERQALRKQVRQLEQDRDDERMEYQSKFYRMRDGLEAQVVALREQVDAAASAFRRIKARADRQIADGHVMVIDAIEISNWARVALRDVEQPPKEETHGS